VDEPKSFGNPELLKDPKFTNGQLSTTASGQPATVSQKRSDLNELADLAARDAGEEFLLRQELEQACLATGATGAAIALVRGEKIVCHATVGPDAPDIGVCIDPRNGLSGSCIQTRSLQQCHDTETDSRVDPEASRSLGVRSIVVLPLIEGDKLFGIFEVLSSRPNAFKQRDLETLQALTDRVVRSRSQNWESTVIPKPEGSALVVPVVPEVDEKIVQQPASEVKAAIPHPARISRKTDLLAATLGVLVIAAAVLLGGLVGWRQGWQEATLALRPNSPSSRASASLKGQTNHTLPAGTALPPSSTVTDECGQSAAAGSPAQPPSGGLTVCDQGQVIFRLPASTLSPAPTLRSAKSLPDLPRNAQRR
jgi:putative methionine-R-sulfoxide reductase with GAF domain